MDINHSREPHQAFVVVELCGDIEPMFESFATYEEAAAYLDEREIGYKAWIIGPEWTEDRS